MADKLSDRTIPYEILIRFGEDGAFKAAHQQRRRIVQLGAEVLKEEVLPAEPLQGEDFTAAIGEAASRALQDGSAALARAESAEQAAANLREQLEAAQASIASMQSAMHGLTEEKQALSVKVESLERDLDAAATARAVAEAQVSVLTRVRGEAAE